MKARIHNSTKSLEEDKPMNRYRWIQWIVLAGIVVLIAAGCSTKDSQPIDPPQTEYLENEETLAQTVSVTEEQSKTNVSLYFKDPQGYVVPISMEVPSVEYIARQALQYMTINGPAEDRLPFGFTALLPEGTEVKGMNILPDEKLAIVDFSKEFSHYESKDERKIMEAVTWALTEFPTIDQVQIWVDGEFIKQMPVAGTPMDEPLSRAMGINIERAEGVNLGQSTPVTLYFQNQTTDHQAYFVPVTRMIERTDDIARSAVEHLIKGPNASTNLIPVMVSGVEVLKIQQSEDVISVYLTDEIFDANHKAPTESLQSVILSLTENTGASKIQIMVDSHVEVNSTENINYSTPAARPAHVNQFKM
jgi:germination protein M